MEMARLVRKSLALASAGHDTSLFGTDTGVIFDGSMIGIARARVWDPAEGDVLGEDCGDIRCCTRWRCSMT